MPTHKPGYYWVRWTDGAEWDVAWYSGSGWYGWSMSHGDPRSSATAAGIAEIGPRIEPPRRKAG